MNELAKSIIMLGVVLILIGTIFLFFNKLPGIGKLPGDIIIKKENFNFYFPITSCIILSFIISLIIYLWNHR
ncbi:MAG: DUF2905 domain-containing protein [Candidatus Omnitrophica bacterium]|nr:DUF2905 domain-containing protein [Candidatus Omnitrophota bacterium]MCB9746890.1 DUF2905 domain-containing protein [Candidatus Omnitrophota bacterium]